MRRRAFFTLAAASGVSALAAPLLRPRVAHAGACAPAAFAATYLTPAGITIGAGGAILLGVRMQFGGDGERTDPLRQGSYTLVRDEATLPLRAEHLAPGLTRLLPPRGASGPYVVRGPAGDLAVNVVASAARAPRACFLRGARVERFPGSSQPYSPETWGVTAELRDAIPRDVIGALVAPEASGAPYGLFTAATAGERSLALYHSPGRCAADVPGASPPGADQTIRLALVGANGAVSVRSNHVTIES